MSLRVIVRTDYAGMACNVGGAVQTEFRTFDIEASEIETFLREKLGTYEQRQIIGVEVTPIPSAQRGEVST